MMAVQGGKGAAKECQTITTFLLQEATDAPEAKPEHPRASSSPSSDGKWLYMSAALRSVLRSSPPLAGGA